jgi:hypothetical protein
MYWLSLAIFSLSSALLSLGLDGLGAFGKYLPAAPPHCLANSYIPRYVKFVKEYPTAPLGKVQKFKMRGSAIKEYSLE